MVAKGYAQHYVDYFDTFSPLSRFETIRMLLSIVAQMEWKVYQFDVKSALLNGFLDDDFYGEQPEGFVIQGNEKSAQIEKGIIWVEASTESLVWLITFIS